MAKLTRSVDGMKMGNLETIQEIRDILKPQTTYEHPATFRPNLDIRPAPLVSNCTLTDVNKFIIQFTKYIQPGQNCMIPGIILSQAEVNMDIWWLNEARNKGFNGETSLAEFTTMIKEI